MESPNPLKYVRISDAREPCQTSDLHRHPTEVTELNRSIEGIFKLLMRTGELQQRAKLTYSFRPANCCCRAN